MVLCCAIVVMITVNSELAKAGAFQNGSFEQNGFIGLNNRETLVSGDTSITGWTVGSAVNLNRTYLPAADGTFSVELEQGTGSISQTFTTTIGQTYNVGFEMGGDAEGGPDLKKMDVLATGGATQRYTYILSQHGTNFWVTESYAFTATDISTTLTFTSVTTDYSGVPILPFAFGPTLDNVTIDGNGGNSGGGTVPEPSSFVLLGVGGVGLALAEYRRRRIHKAV